MAEEFVLKPYVEAKPHRMRRLAWIVVERAFFRLLVGLRLHKLRNALLRLFGAKVGYWSMIYPTVEIFAPWNFEMGESGCIAPGVYLYNKDRIVLGKQVTISQGAYLCTASHDFNSPTMKLVTKPIVVGDLAWIASRATILPGVTIGEGAVVGACSVVAKDVAPWTVVAGNPARVVGKRELK